MNWDGIEFRQYERFDGTLVPDNFKFVFVEQGIGTKVKASTTDFSIKGIRLLIPSLLKDMQPGDGIIIYPGDESYKLIGEIVYIKTLDNDTLYAGIKFLRTSSLKKYVTAIEEAEINMIEAVHS